MGTKCTVKFADGTKDTVNMLEGKGCMGWWDRPKRDLMTPSEDKPEALNMGWTVPLTIHIGD